MFSSFYLISLTEQCNGKVTLLLLQKNTNPLTKPLLFPGSEYNACTTLKGKQCNKNQLPLNTTLHVEG